MIDLTELHCAAGMNPEDRIKILKKIWALDPEEFYKSSTSPGGKPEGDFLAIAIDDLRRRDPADILEAVTYWVPNDIAQRLAVEQPHHLTLGRTGHMNAAGWALAAV